MAKDSPILISPTEIRAKARRWFDAFLSASVNNSNAKSEPFFPREIRFTKVKTSWVKLHFESLHQQLIILRQESKSVKGAGYTVRWQEVANRTIGKNEFPEKIIIENTADFLSLLPSELHQAYEHFQRDTEAILLSFPELEEWVKNYPQKVVKYSEVWPFLIRVCQYFMQSHQRDQHYIRELPIDIHTKFVEQHKSILHELFIILLPASRVDNNYKDIREHHFERRYGLRYDETLIRYRLLTPGLSGITDFSIRHSDFVTHEIPGKRIIITENKLNFLTLPLMADTLAIWGAGFNVNLLSRAKWLEDREIYYWGDIDTHGLWILSQLRAVHPQVINLMMNKATFDAFRQQVGIGKPIGDVNIGHLTEEEFTLFQFLKTKNLRLEQEKIDHGWVLYHLEIIR